MIKALESVLISSGNATALAKFYRETVGLKQEMEMEMGDRGEKAFSFTFGTGANLAILDHSEVKGNNKNPQRLMFNLEVDKIEEEVERLEKAKVKKIQDTYHIEGYGLIATFEDPDGNYFQLVQIRASG